MVVHWEISSMSSRARRLHSARCAMIKFKSMLKPMAAQSFFRASKRSCYRFWGRLVQRDHLQVRVDQLEPSVQDLLVQEGLAALAQQGLQDSPDQLVILDQQGLAALAQQALQDSPDQLVILDQQGLAALAQQALQDSPDQLVILDQQGLAALAQQALQDS